MSTSSVPAQTQKQTEVMTVIHPPYLNPEMLRVWVRVRGGSEGDGGGGSWGAVKSGGNSGGGMGEAPPEGAFLERCEAHGAEERAVWMQRGGRWEAGAAEQTRDGGKGEGSAQAQRVGAPGCEEYERRRRAQRDGYAADRDPYALLQGREARECRAVRERARVLGISRREPLHLVRAAGLARRIVVPSR